jgi:hypothetical protein
MLISSIPHVSMQKRNDEVRQLQPRRCCKVNDLITFRGPLKREQEIRETLMDRTS